MAQAVTDANFQEEVLNASLPVLVDFWAPWCGPCQMMGPLVEKLSAEYEGKCKIVKLDVQDHAEQAAIYGVQGIPCFKVFKNGEEVDGAVGAMPEPKLRELIEKNI